MGNPETVAASPSGTMIKIIEIVERRAGGFRLVVRMFSRHGMPVVEACSTVFSRMRDAEDYATRFYGVGQEQLRCN